MASVNYEKPTEYWYIDTYEGTVIEKTVKHFELTDKEREEIGNYFETKEEAERAVRKLKALKSLKDKGFKINGWYLPKDGEARVIIEGNAVPNTVNEINILFGGEDEWGN